MLSRAAAALLLASGLGGGGIGVQESVAVRPPLLERIAGDAFFAKLPLKGAPGFPLVDLVLQEPCGERPGWKATASNRFGPWMRELAAQFEQRIATPLALERGDRIVAGVMGRRSAWARPQERC